MTSSEHFIDGLVADLPQRRRRWGVVPMLALAAAAGALMVFVIVWFGFRHSPHLAEGLTRTLGFSVIAALVLAAGTWWISLELSHPEADPGLRWPLALTALILLGGLAIELWHTPPALWAGHMYTPSSLPCFACVTLLGLPVLAAVLIALRRGATVHPTRAGAAAGFLAGGITGALYQIHCPEDTLFCFAIWHVGAIVLLAGLGAVLGRYVLRW